jgi:hypothetical protein
MGCCTGASVGRDVQRTQITDVRARGLPILPLFRVNQQAAASTAPTSNAMNERLLVCNIWLRGIGGRSLKSFCKDLNLVSHGASPHSLPLSA